MAGPKKDTSRQSREAAWTFLSNHGHVLVCIAQNPDVRIAEIADLVAGGYVVRTKDGRRNTYTVDFDMPLRHPLEADHTIGEIFRVIAGMRRTRR